MENVLVDSDKYFGQYVALKSFEDHTIVGAGKDPETALRSAQAQGFKDPVLLYVPNPDTVQIY